jgi:hypothetical protein
MIYNLIQEDESQLASLSYDQYTLLPRVLTTLSQVSRALITI